MLVFNEDDFSLAQTLCGTHIAIKLNGEIRTATLGGIVMIYNKDSSDADLFGITAGHIASSCLPEVAELGGEQMTDAVEEMSYDDTFEEDFELDIESDEGETDEPQRSELIPQSKDEKIQCEYTIGTLVADASTDNDWALIRVESSRCLPNFLPSIKASAEQSELSCGNPPRLGFEMEAVAVCARHTWRPSDTTASGLVYGTISRYQSGFMMSPGSQFVEVYDFKPKKHSSKPQNTGQLQMRCHADHQ